jgi:hypothetical protein
LDVGKQQVGKEDIRDIVKVAVEGNKYEGVEVSVGCGQVADCPDVTSQIKLKHSVTRYNE